MVFEKRKWKTSHFYGVEGRWVGNIRHDGASHDNIKPLYSILDALNCLDYFGRTASYDQVFEVAAGVRATFIDAGHILGSASIFLELEEQGHLTSVLFSGDLGNAGRLLLRAPQSRHRPKTS